MTRSTACISFCANYPNTCKPLDLTQLIKSRSQHSECHVAPIQLVFQISANLDCYLQILQTVTNSLPTMHPIDLLNTPKFRQRKSVPLASAAPSYTNLFEKKVCISHPCGKSIQIPGGTGTPSLSQISRTTSGSIQLSRGTVQ